MLNVTYALMVEDSGGLMASPVEVRDRLDQVLAEVPEGMRGEEPDPEAWGTDPDAQAGLEAAMRLAGGPPGGR